MKLKSTKWNFMSELNLNFCPSLQTRNFSFNYTHTANTYSCILNKLNYNYIIPNDLASNITCLVSPAVCCTPKTFRLRFAWRFLCGSTYVITPKIQIKQLSDCAKTNKIKLIIQICLADLLEIGEWNQPADH